jgi:Arc/MetJ-type ribon-helix-helix transcriptional regulator
MAILNISDDDLAFVREQVEAGASPNADDYVSRLIRAEQRRKAKASLEAEALKGFDSGPSTPIDEDFWNGVRNRVRARLDQQARQ